MITPRPPPISTNKETTSFPALMSGVSSDGAGGSFAFGTGVRCGTGATSRQLRSSERGARQQRGRSRKGAKRKGSSGGPPYAANSNENRSEQQRRRRHPNRGGGAGTSGGGGGDSRLFGDDHRKGEGSRGSRRGRGQSRSGRGGPDDATSWPVWHTTGIPSWDILVSRAI